MSKRILKPLELAQAQNELLFTRTALPTHKKLIIYARQSTKDQVVKNKESAAQQTNDLWQQGIETGWQEEDIVLFVENYYDRYGRLTDKIRHASGRLRIDQRPGLSIVTDMIKRDEVGAILIWDVSRLFRDETMIMPAIFAELCKEHHVLVLTPDTMFDFNNPRSDDRKRFLDEAQNAADYLSKQVGKMQKARTRKALRGEFAGHRIPVGLMLDEERKHFIPSPHAPQVKALFRRFRQLNGDFAAFRREVVGSPVFPELEDFPIDTLALTRVTGGWTVKGRDALRDLLTNPAYVGCVTWNRQIVQKNAHPAIVDEDDFFFAFNRLSSVDLDGNPIEHPERTVRYVQIHGLPCDALLWGVRPNGQAVLTSPGKRVHVARTVQSPEKNSYKIFDSGKITVNQIIGSILITRLDSIFT